MMQKAWKLALLWTFTLLLASPPARAEEGLQAPVTPPPGSDLPAPSLGPPVESAPLSVPKDSPAPVTMPAPPKETAGLSSPTPPGSSAPAEVSKTEKSESPIPPEEKRPEPSESAPLPVAESEETSAPPPATPTAESSGKDRGLYRDFRDYQDKEADREATEQEYSHRALFAHEDGAWQLGIDYTRNAFAGYNFGAGLPDFSTQGGVVSLYYFPIRDLSYGRLGLGIQAGMFWTKYHYSNGAQSSDVTARSFMSYGGRVAYEFDYFLGQWLVPHVFYGVEQVSGRPHLLANTTITIASRNFTSKEYGGGLHLNLNRIEPTAASKALVSTGVRKYYLTYTALMHQTGNAGNGLTHFLGLRFEY